MSTPFSAAAAAADAQAKEKTYVFNPDKAKSERGKAHAAALHQQQFAPLMPVLPLYRRRGALVLTALACVLFAFGLHILQSGNVLLTLRPHNFADCRVVRGPVGAEDLAIDATAGGGGVAFISADARTWVPLPGRESLFSRAAEVPGRMARLRFDEQGALWAYDARPASVSSTAGQIVRLEIEGLTEEVKDVHPHGLCIPAKPKAGTRGTASSPEKEEEYPTFVYVLNHQRDGDKVLVLEVQYPRVSVSAGGAKSQTHLWPPRVLFGGLLSDPAVLTGVNDLEALYPLRRTDAEGRPYWLHSMYVSNFMGSRLGDTAWNVLEMLSQARWGSVALCQARQMIDAATTGALLPTNCTVAVDRISGPNGLALSLDQRFLYVAQTLTQEMSVFALPNASADAGAQTEQAWHGSLSLRPLRPFASQYIGSGLDNINLDRVSGDLFVGSHPKPLQVTAHLADASKRSPTQVLRLHHNRRSLSDTSPDGEDDGVFSVREVHLSTGEVFSGSSVGAWNRATKELIIGGVADDGIFICPYEEEKTEQQ